MKDGKVAKELQGSWQMAMHAAVSGREGLRAIDVNYERKKKEIKINNLKPTIMNKQIIVLPFNFLDIYIYINCKFFTERKDGNVWKCKQIYFVYCSIQLKTNLE